MPASSAIAPPELNLPPTLRTDLILAIRVSILRKIRDEAGNKQAHNRMTSTFRMTAARNTLVRDVDYETQQGTHCCDNAAVFTCMIARGECWACYAVCRRSICRDRFGVVRQWRLTFLPERGGFFPRSRMPWHVAAGRRLLIPCYGYASPQPLGNTSRGGGTVYSRGHDSRGMQYERRPSGPCRGRALVFRGTIVI